MQRLMLKSKIHKLTVTDANLDYEGSITIDEELMHEAEILPYEQVNIYNVTNGNRFHTYAIKGQKGSGIICINGAAAHLAKKGDVIIVATYAMLENMAAIAHKPICVHVDESNKIKDVKRIAVGM
ncbi:MAG: aspartate 1-decarboxylase [Deltaproteobacteria bacterium GWC2_42_11]|nr:MAG: aspartate 1-decarboxylase [Deltaproteobacteria bacterium GWC2_42_11]HBO83525.1 aspartate 1-decarboxylase [Deltaproteobacteria bacterium]